MSRPTLILASSSAARKLMLRQAGLDFTAIAPEVDEAAMKAGASGSMEDLALRLARAKAAKIAAAHKDALVIGADQLLVCGAEIFNKPAGLPAAAAHLRALRGRAHALVTAACVMRGNEVLWHEVAAPVLHMRPLSDAFIEDYVAAEGEPLCATVGAYRLEGRGIQLFERIEGDFFTILGLPLLGLLAFLRAAGALA